MAAAGVEAATDGAAFRAYLEQVLPPEPRRAKLDAVLVMDDLGAHETPAVRELLGRSGFSCRCLPSYSPDLNPIEPAWAKVEAGPRWAAARAAEALHRALGPALGGVTAAAAAACFRRCGYGRPS